MVKSGRDCVLVSSNLNEKTRTTHESAMQGVFDVTTTGEALFDLLSLSVTQV